MTEPNFEKWGFILSLASKEPRASLELTITNGLKEAFDQGYQLGRIEGYEEGLNKGWAIEQDKEYVDKEGNKEGNKA